MGEPSQWLPDDWNGTLKGIPLWWLFVAGDGLMPTPEQREALTAAHQRLTRYRGERLRPEAIVFVPAVVRDALYAAPQPVTKHWVAYSLTVISGLVRSCDVAGMPLDRGKVFSERTRQRFLHVTCAGMVSMAQAGYRSRLDVITEALQNTPGDTGLSRPTINAQDVLIPYTDREESGLVAWAAGTRPASRRQRVRALLALDAGCGARRRDMVVIHGADVSRDGNGVHVRIGGTLPRTVTCLSTYEAMLWQAAKQAGAGLVIAPDKHTIQDATLTASLTKTNQQRPPTPIMIRRLRNTWLARHLTAGTPLAALLPAAGLAGLKHIEDLLPHIAAPANPAVTLRGIRP